MSKRFHHLDSKIDQEFKNVYDSAGLETFNLNQEVVVGTFGEKPVFQRILKQRGSGTTSIVFTDFDTTILEIILEAHSYLVSPTREPLLGTYRGIVTLGPVAGSGLTATATSAFNSSFDVYLRFKYTRK